MRRSPAGVINGGTSLLADGGRLTRRETAGLQSVASYSLAPIWEPVLKRNSGRNQVG
ncbi:MAG: hypothetical protein ACI9SB_000812 [Candidatus Azotimanducaceae bacterium]|jgi:hypothetical protein